MTPPNRPTWRQLRKSYREGLITKKELRECSMIWARKIEIGEAALVSLEELEKARAEWEILDNPIPFFRTGQFVCGVHTTEEEGILHQTSSGLGIVLQGNPKRCTNFDRPHTILVLWHVKPQLPKELYDREKKEGMPAWSPPETSIQMYEDLSRASPYQIRKWSPIPHAVL